MSFELAKEIDFIQTERQNDSAWKASAWQRCEDHSQRKGMPSNGKGFFPLLDLLGI